MGKFNEMRSYRYKVSSIFAHGLQSLNYFQIDSLNEKETFLHEKIRRTEQVS